MLTDPEPEDTVPPVTALTPAPSSAPPLKKAIVPAPAPPSGPDGPNARDEMLREGRRFHTGVVAFLDILGTRGIHNDVELAGEVERRVRVQSAFAADSYSRVLGAFFSVIEAFVRKPGEETSADRAINKRAFAFSDSIVLTAWTEAHPESLVHRIAEEIAPKILPAMKEGIFLRGAISFGQFYSDEYGLVLGPAAIDAIEWAEQAEWIGVQLAPSAYYAWRTALWTGPGAPSMIRACKVPLKGSEIELAAVDWALEFRADSSRLEALNTELMHSFSLRPIPPKDAAKFRNTIEFVGPSTAETR